MKIQDILISINSLTDKVVHNDETILSKIKERTKDFINKKVN